MGERYIHHPNFGLLYSICTVGDGTKNLFTTLYAHRLFFLVTERPGELMSYESISRNESRQLIEERRKFLRNLKSLEVKEELDKLEVFCTQAFL